MISMHISVFGSSVHATQPRATSLGQALLVHTPLCACNPQSHSKAHVPFQAARGSTSPARFTVRSKTPYRRCYGS